LVRAAVRTNWTRRRLDRVRVIAGPSGDRRPSRAKEAIHETRECRFPHVFSPRRHGLWRGRGTDCDKIGGRKAEKVSKWPGPTPSVHSAGSSGGPGRPREGLSERTRAGAQRGPAAAGPADIGRHGQRWTTGTSFRLHRHRPTGLPAFQVHIRPSTRRQTPSPCSGVWATGSAHSRLPVCDMHEWNHLPSVRAHERSGG
jgi:hypothetical protein